MFEHLLDYFGALGSYLGSEVGEAAEDAAIGFFAWAMQGLWAAAQMLLKGAFNLADRLSVFSITGDGSPVETTWPVTLWISGVVALALFFWQLTMTALRGGRGFVRLVSGPAQYGIALGLTVGMVAALLVAADELTRGLLAEGLDAKSFRDALKQTAFSVEGIDGLKAIALGLCALFGVLPAAFGYVLEMLFREAAIHVLIAVVPITAAGLTASGTSSWFWTTLRWILAAVLMKPVLALTLVLGVSIADGSKGITGILVGTAVLLMSLFSPLALFRLFSFVDPSTDAGGAFRNFVSSFGVSSYGSGNPVTGMQTAALGNAVDRVRGGGGADGGDDSSGLAEARTAQRMDNAADGYNPYAYRGAGSTNSGAGADGGESSGGPGGSGGSGPDSSDRQDTSDNDATVTDPADAIEPAVADSADYADPGGGGGAVAGADVGFEAAPPHAYGGGPAPAGPATPLAEGTSRGSAPEGPDSSGRRGAPGEFDDGVVQ
jgi:hypothetical protein